ncbi:hypothetical protein QQX98_011270 [Neonectria punicea]|uniref:ATPase AAA-type core domain-containing protein n=1 Tax=Neonectria punicea TaxID=979145 RepID=A0ABR1GMD2_9HYPO
MAPQRDWDFVLPKLLPPLGPFLSGTRDDGVVRAIQHGGTVEAARRYLNAYEKSSVEAHINDNVKGFPAIFYTVAANSEDVLRLFIEFGADVSAVQEPSRTPLLAFAILNGGVLQISTAPIVSTLLSHGADPLFIPSDLFTPYARDPPTGPKKDDDEIEISPLTDWCTDETRTKLAKAADITQRYYLERATKIKKPSKKRTHIAQLKNAEGLLGVPYFLIGQSIAVKLLIQRLLSHLLLPTKQALVLYFARPSGHGKTELARQVGHLLSLNLEVVDCTIVRHEVELFSPRAPYHGSRQGSPVNNFLAEHSGQRCIIVMDEFEKTTREIHQALLLPFDNSEYQNRRDHGKVDCSNTIWILATNALNDEILDFCEENEAIFGEDDEEKLQLTKKLSRELRDALLRYFSAPVTGRVSDLVPFLPFSEGEQAVVTHKSLLELSDKLRRRLQAGSKEKLVGDIRLSIRRDATVCRLLAQANYHKKLGARSLVAGAKKVERIVLNTYLDEDEEIRENGGLRDFIIDVQGDEIVGRAAKTN